MGNSLTRLYYIDNLKGLLILLVILGHCIQQSDIDFDNNIVFRYIYAFHMPLFMYLSGFVSYKKIYRWSQLKKRSIQLLIPFLAWAMLGMTISNNFNWMWLTKPDTGLWFLWVLFWIGALHISLSKLAYKINVIEEIILSIACIVLLGSVIVSKLSFGFHLIAWYFPFYLLGVFSRKYDIIVIKYLEKYKWLLLGMFILDGYFWMRNESPTFLNTKSPIIIMGYKFLIGIIGCYCFMALIRPFNNKWLIISELGGGMTLGLYAIHQSVIKYILVLQDYYSLKINSLWLTITLLFIATCLFTIIIYLIFNKLSFTRRLLLGK